ncbi:MAG: hypothetical protein GY768_16180 [Planctomycetaceae bacterium]|nr:hypothetical protein [Planctomycetaceae bacterium]
MILAFAIEVGLAVPLAQVGLSNLTQDDLAKIAVRATAEGETIHNEPFEVIPNMVSDAILAANSIGRNWERQHAKAC